MVVKTIRNKKFHIPTDRIKDAKKVADEEEALRHRIDAMTNEEYEEYIKAELAEIDNYTEDDYMSEEEFWKRFNEDCNLLDRERRNYKNWRKLLEDYRKIRVMDV